MLEDHVATNRACYGGNELNDGLMRQAHRVFENAPPEDLSCRLLLIGETAIEPVHQNVRINENGHARKASLFSSRGRETASL